jgi:hypothetical protein
MKRFLQDILTSGSAGKYGRAEWTLHWLLAAAIVLPLAIFAAAATISYRETHIEARDRLQRNLGTVYEHALKVLETVELAARYLDEMLNDASDPDLRANEAHFHLRLKSLTDVLPQFADIWIVDADGHPVVAGTVFPIPRELDLSDRDYFRAHKNSDSAGLYIGSVVTARATNARGQPRFFSLSRRRVGVDGKFGGVTVISISPDYFRDYYSTLTQPVVAALVRGDGTVLALGVPIESLHGTPRVSYFGAVYLFRRDGTTWHLEQRLTGTIRSGNYFGKWLDIDDAGETLVVGRLQDDSGTLGFGITDIYRHGDVGWQHTQTLPVTVTNANRDNCSGMALSGDGHTFVRACDRDGSELTQVYPLQDGFAGTPIEFLSGGTGPIDVNFDGTRIITRGGPYTAEIWALQSSSWGFDGRLLTGAFPSLLNSVSLSRDGKLAAIASSDNSPLSGPIYAPLTNGAVSSMSVSVFERRSSGWVLRRTLKPAVHILNNNIRYGDNIALGDNGRVLAVGSPTDSSAATGIDGDPMDTSSPNRGAAWLY